MYIIKRFLKEKRGHILIQVIIAMIIGGLVAYKIVNNDILPGLKTKWETQNSTIQNDWLR